MASGVASLLVSALAPVLPTEYLCVTLREETVQATMSINYLPACIRCSSWLLPPFGRHACMCCA